MCLQLKWHWDLVWSILVQQNLSSPHWNPEQLVFYMQKYTACVCE